jgi:hypothetical protein
MSVQKDLTILHDEESDIRGISSDPTFFQLYLKGREEERSHQDSLAAARQKFFAPWC